MKRIQAARGALIAVTLLALAACAVREPAPSRTKGAAPRTPPATAKAPTASSDYYAVKRGDTLYSIALEHGADYRELAQWNGLTDPTKISVGQQLRVKPPPGTDRVAVAPVKGAGGPEARPLEGGTRPTETKAAPKASAEPVRATDAIEFIWPAKGKVIAGFSEPRSKGIDIDGKLGDPVVAAAAGRVTYIGSGIPGLGKLVVIKHDAGFITVYAHNKEILVKEQQAVTRGQKIAEIGATDSDRPKLHFQIRKGSAPVDPMRYLPSS
jgi:lipoprotein NlpD